TERQGQFALGAITRPGMDGLPVGSTGLIGSLNAHHGANAIAVRASSCGADADRVVAAAALVVEQVGRTAIGRYQDIGSAVVIDVRVGGATCHQRARKPELLTEVRKPAVPLV